jgi:hypothetical protein
MPTHRGGGQGDALGAVPALSPRNVTPAPVGVVALGTLSAAVGALPGR